jgi:HD-GYP domain-containing protein (c-di-GMP phosphodiesterase class II)
MLVRLMPVTRAAGLRLARNIPAVDPRQMPLLRANAALSERYCAALHQSGFRSVWVHDELSDGIEPVDLVPEEVRQEVGRTVSAIQLDAERALRRGEPLSPAALADLHAVVDQLAGSVTEHPGAALALNDIAAADAYTHQHSIDVCALGLLLGRAMMSHGWKDHRGHRRFDDIERRMRLLGVGLLLHDIGKLAVPHEILVKPDRLTDEEMAIMRTHPDAGAELLSAEAYSPLVRAVVREHHERWDGSGYPQGLAGEAINQLARIAAVADVYDAVTSERPYQPGLPPYRGAQIILDGSGTAFDPKVVDIFQRVVPRFPVGSELRLHDGTSGVVARIDPEHPTCPWVRFPDGERPVDLDAEPLAA